MPPKRRSVGAMRDEERAEEKEEAREEEEEEEEEKKYEEEEEEEEEEKDDDLDNDEVDDDDLDDDEVDDDDDDYEVDDDDDDYEVDDDDVGDDDDDVDDYDVGEILKKTKRKPATKIANQRRKIRRFPIRKTCCFAGAQGYSCHKGDPNVRATRCVPESERNKFPEHARCCVTCYNHLQDAYFFHLGRVCSDCSLLGYDRATTPGAWMAWRGLHGNTLLCSKCFENKSKERVRRRKGIMKRRKGRKAKGDW
jgi:hypothetical protein